MDSLLSEPPFYASWAEKIKEWLSQAKISIKWEPYESYFTQIAIDRIGMPDFKKIVKLGKIDTNGEAYRLAVIREAERQETIFNDPWRALKLFEHIGIDISQYPEYRNGLVQAAYSKLCGKRWLSTDISTEDGLELDGLYRFLKKMGEEPNVNRALEMPDRNLEQGNLHAAMQGYDAIDSTTNIGPERKRILKLLEHNSGKYKWEQLDIPTRIKIQIMAKRAGIKSPSFI
jgi:hypothetical protein